MTRKETSTYSCEDCVYEPLFPQGEPCRNCKNSYMYYIEAETSEAEKMTKEKRKAAINYFKRSYTSGNTDDERLNNEICDMAIEVLERIGEQKEKEDTLGKIKAEIKDWQNDIHDNEYDADKYDFVFERIYEIISEVESELSE